MHCVVYEFKVKPGREGAFEGAWAAVTDAIHRVCGSRGSRLHRTNDPRLYIAYAQWPDRERFAAAAKAIGYTDEEQAARAAMKDATESLRVVYELDVADDRLRARVQHHLSLRDATTADAPILGAAQRAIAEVEGRLASRPSELGDAVFEAKIAALTKLPNAKYIVAESHGAIVGHALLEPMALEATRHIVRLTTAVHPGHERNGIGSALLGALIASAETNPLVVKIELNVRATNHAAIALYKKHGFVVQGEQRARIRFTDGTFCDDLEMRRFVDGSGR